MSQLTKIPSRADVRRAARDVFGFDTLRPGQEEAIAAAAAGRDTLAVLPTGSGKSAIYQVAGSLIPGPTIVVSPLIALQRDQVEKLREAGLKAAEANSKLSRAEREESFRALELGEIEFLLLAPEQLANQETLERLRDCRPSLLVVDEAHCVSEWGHDFRPDYLRLGAVVDTLGHPTTLALTATAAPPVREEILSDLHMIDPAVVVAGFDRPNLHFSVETFQDEKAKREALVQRVVAAEKPGIVYVATRRAGEELGLALACEGLRSVVYHAGLRTKQREAAQRAFMDDAVDVLVATVAFGMGIDKSNVRFVFHESVSDSIDSYYQEIGRAGRDGKPAELVLFFRNEDLGLRKYFAAGGMDLPTLERVAALVMVAGRPVSPSELAEVAGLSDTRLLGAINRLEKAGALRVTATGDIVAVEGHALDAVAVAAAADERRRRIDKSRLEMVRAYAESRECRRQFLLNYFGESYIGPCPACDNCGAGSPMAEPHDVPFPAQTRVRHRAWGDGLVVRHEGADKMVVLFDDVGYKSLSVPLVLEGKLLDTV